MKYEGNPKHKEPWQRGQKGSLCDKEVHPLAEKLLKESCLVGQARYAVHNGKAYCAREHAKDCWHGYPVGWVEVPSKLKRRWVKEKRVTKRELDKYREGHA
jgi:hypothetical protein